jgi:hypothetical protein
MSIICSTGVGSGENPPGGSVHDIGKPLTVSVKRARELLDISHTTVWKLIGEKKVDTVQLGTKRLVIFNSLERLIDKLREASSEEAA